MSAATSSLHPPLEKTSPSSSSGSHMTHSRQMSSLSMTTFTTISPSPLPSQHLLRNVEHRGAPSRPPLNPDISPEERNNWEMEYDRRMRRLHLLRGFFLLILGFWAPYTVVRYCVAYAIYPDSTRRSVALSLAISTLLSLLVAAALALSRVFSYHLLYDRPHVRSLSKFLRYGSHLLASVLLFIPAMVNFVLVFVWRDTGSDLSLRGRCHWDLDVVWAGVGGQCSTHSPVWGVWVTGAILRLALTVAVLIAYHVASRAHHTSRWLSCCHHEDAQRSATNGVPQMTQSDVPSRPLPLLRAGRNGGSSRTPQRSLSGSRRKVIPEFSEPHRQVRKHDEPVYSGLDSAGSSTQFEDGSNPRSTESDTAPAMSLSRKKSTRDMRANENSARQQSNAEERQLQGFADRFRALVDRVSVELEESRNLESNTEPIAPPLHHVLDTHMPYMTIDEFGREVPSEEPIAMLGGVIRRMPTIDSVGSREVSSLRSNTLVGGVGSPSRATSSSASSRPPTRATMISLNDAASASLTNTSQPSSRSNSIHRHRMPPELARSQSRPLPPPPGMTMSGRPASGGSMNGSIGGDSASAVQRSRSNSLGPSEVLAPVTEHGELGRGNAPPLRVLRRLGDPSEHLAGAVGVNEMGELMRAEWARSWASSSQSATSTAYFSAATGSTGGGSGSGDNGSGSNPGGRSRRGRDENKNH